MKVDLEKRDFFKDQLSESEIKKIIKLAGISPKELLRKKDKMYKELDLENKNLSDSQIIKLLVKHPGLIKRPIIINEGKISIEKINSKEV